MLRMSITGADASGESKSRPGVPDGFRLEVYFSTGFLHLLLTVHAQDINVLCSTDRLTATGTHILTGTAGLFGLGVCSAELTGAGDCKLISPFLSGTEAFQIGGGLGNGKTYVLQAIRLEGSCAKGTIRISLGKANTEDDVEVIFKALMKVFRA